MSYGSEMMPYAKKTGSQLGMPPEVILAQWSLETGYGGSSLAKNHNNHAGIKNNSRGRDYVAGAYAGYNSINSFVDDYVRVMRLSYYDKVRSAGSVRDTVIELHKSPWAEDTKYDDKMFSVLKKIGTVVSNPVEDIGGGLSGIQDKIGSMGTEELKKYATVGLGAALLISLLND
jgi:flagellum-specific peptidoglycan hydrolase FlgJ